MDNDQISNDDQESLLRGRVTVEQLLLAANVLSTQNPQGANLDRQKLLEDARQFVLEATEVSFMTAFKRDSQWDDRMKLYAKYGYRQPYEELQLAWPELAIVRSNEFVPYKQAALEITKLKTKKQAVISFEKFIEKSDLRMIWDVIKVKGVWKDKIPELRERVKEYFARRNKWQNTANAKHARKKSKKSS